MKLTREQYINKFYPVALKATRGTNVYPETVLTIAVIESADKAPDGNYYPGYDETARLLNNHFGIKAEPGYRGQKALLDTRKDASKKSYFRVYNTPEDSYIDFVRFLYDNPRYKQALKAPDYVTQLVKIAAAGYAENPSYSNMLQTVSKSIHSKISQLPGEIKKAPAFTALFLILLFSAIGFKIQSNAKPV